MAVRLLSLLFTISLFSIPTHSVGEVPIRQVRVSLEEKDPHPRLEQQANVTFPGEKTFFLFRSTTSWVHEASLSFDLYWPANGPADAQVMVHMKDWDHLWYQNLLPDHPVPGKTNRFTVSLAPTSSNWQPADHQAAWHLRALMAPRQFAVRIFSKRSYSGTIVLNHLTTLARKEEGAPTIRHVIARTPQVSCYGKFEISLDLPDRYPDPFDDQQILLEATFSSPSGKRIRVEGFYGRDYYRIIDTTGEQIHPQSRPYWRIRFCPTEPGIYTYTVNASDPLGEATWGPVSFEVQPSSSSGFIRVSKQDPRYFEHDNGRAYFPIGHNTRSPFDNRTDKQFPWKQRFPEGSAAYTRYFRDMGRHGENLAEVWSAAWSLGLEWASRRPGYHGIGQYNLRHAWEMDRVLAAAETNGIYLNYVVHNHGKFGTFYDHEWELNPFNKQCGGYLDSPEEYFTDPRAKNAFRKLMRYTVARWAYSPHIFAWELWSELNLTGSDKRETNYKRPEVVAWHKTMGRMMKQIDPYQHLVGTHISGDYKKQNKHILALPEMDFCPVDAYHYSPDPVHIVELMKRTARFNNTFEKPVLITEFGGSHMAAGVKHLEDTLHAALWASTSIPLAGTPLFWWWQIIEEENFYPHFQAVRNFIKDEDHRDPCMKPVTPRPLNRHNGYDLKAVCLKNQHRAVGWIYRRKQFGAIDPTGQPTVTNATFRIDHFTNKTCVVEFWDTQTGQPVSRTDTSIESGSITIEAPPFARDIAFKVK